MKISIWHILTSMTVLLLAGIVVFVIWISSFFYQFNVNEAVEEHAQKLEIISSAIAGPSWTLKETYPGTTENILRSVANTSEIEFIRIVNKETKTVEKSGHQEEIGLKIDNLPSFERSISIRDSVVNNKNTKEFSVRARDGTNLWMAVSFDTIKRNVLSATITLGAITLILFMLTVIAVFLITQKIIIKPLILLQNVFEKLKNKNYNEIQLGENSILELDHVFNSFNETAERIEDTESRLADELKRAKELDRLKSEFISTAAHQLRTPLSAVKWTLKMIIDGDLGVINSEQKTFLMQGYQSNERMIDLVNDLLNVARIEEGRFGYKFSLVQLEDLIENIIQEFVHRIEEKKIRFSFNKPPKPLAKAKIDPAKLRLVISNLIDNAIKYTPEMGEVTVSMKYDTNNIELSVKDSGIGIPKDQQNRLFTKFFRSDNALRMQTEGSGLGLFIVKNIIEKHKGKVRVESEENKGATFTFTLPIPK